MVKFEYTTASSQGPILAIANELGAGGWELVTVLLKDNGWYVFFFKRKLE